MKVLVDKTKCQGYGACAETCPSVFELDEWGFAVVRDDGDVPPGEEQRAGEAVRGCPENAISEQ